MDVRLTGWKAKNLRGGLRDVDIDLGDHPCRWTLIQMPNGTGKTTTMALLRATLNGTDLSAKAVRELRADDHVETGFFEARLLVDGKPYRLQLELDFRDGSATCWTVQEKERGGGREEGRNLPTDLRTLLKPALTELFVFNGELATDIIDLSKSSAAGAIRALYGLDTLETLTKRVDALIDLEIRRASAITTAKERKGIVQLQNAFDEVRRANDRLEQQQKTTSARLVELERERARLQEEIQARMSEDAGIRAQIEALDEKQQDVDANTADLSLQALEALRRPAYVHPTLLERLQNLGGKLYELKLPETISREFFNELAQQTRCVCGRPIGHAERHEIVSGAQRYLAQDQISVINQMKLALRESQGDPEELSTTVASLQVQLDERRRIKAERDRLASEKIAEGDEVLKKLREQVAKLSDEITALSSTLERLTTKDPSRQRALRLTWESNQPLCEVELKARDTRLKTATRTRTFALQGEKLKAIVLGTSRRALDILRERVRMSTNDKLAQIFSTEKIEVARIGGSLELRTAGLGAKEGASEGQKLAIAYAFLTSLLAEAPYRLPFIVDSPAVSLDTANRRQVGDLIPDFFNQMVMFVISSEREGFAEAFYDRPDDVRYLTVTPRGGGTVDIAEGLEAFKSFHARED
jgi:predicted nuclease with TOPRIM domain